MKLIDRHAECGVLDGLLEAIHAGESRVLVVSGEPGVGKTALLEYLSEQASGCRLARSCGRAVGDGTAVRRTTSVVRADAR